MDRHRADAHLRAEEAREFLASQGIDLDAIMPHIDGRFMSAYVRGAKPNAQTCCGLIPYN